MWAWVGLLAIVGALAEVPSVPDLCAPCHTADECSGQFCLKPQDPNLPAVCTQGCDPQGGCPSDFSCITDPNNYQSCQPKLASTCTNLYKGMGLNGTCGFPPSATSDGAGIKRACVAGLNCSVLPNGLSGCVQACNATNAKNACPSGFGCCFGISGTCQPSAPTLPAQGGCFQNMQIGDSCSLANQSMCPETSQCLFPPGSSNPSLAACFRLCDSKNLCFTGEGCYTDGSSSSGQCCQVSAYDPKNVSSCKPQPACIGEVGTACTRATDCRSGLCQRADNITVCSKPCDLNNNGTDCPAVGTAGAGSGGTSCQSIGNQFLCWPLRLPSPQVSCPTQLQSSNSGGSTNIGDPFSAGGGSGGNGGNCQAVGGTPLLALLCSATLWAARRRLGHR